jgi:hypothetical protein
VLSGPHTTTNYFEIRRRFASGITGLLIAGAFFTTFALALDQSEDAPVILAPTDDAVVKGPR